MKNKKKFISLLLTASLTMGIMPGCAISKEVNATTSSASSSIEEIEPHEPVQMPQPQITPEPEQKPVQEPEKIKLFNNLQEYYDYLEELPSKDINEVFNNLEENNPLDLAKAAYDNLLKYNLDINDEEIQKELLNVILSSTYPMGFSDEAYEKSFSILASTLTEEQNVFYCYYPLAIGGHLATCPKEHTKNEFDKLECSSIIEYIELLKTPEQVMEEHFGNDEAFLRIKEAMINNNLELEVYLKELENLALLSINPTDIYSDELWNKLFGNLLATLNEDENLYDVYIHLAINYHNLIHPENIITLEEEDLTRV